MSAWSANSTTADNEDFIPLLLLCPPWVFIESSNMLEQADGIGLQRSLPTPVILGFYDSVDYRMVCVGNDLKGHLLPPLPCAGTFPLYQVAQIPTQAGTKLIYSTPSITTQSCSPQNWSRCKTKERSGIYSSYPTHDRTRRKRRGKHCS